MRGGGRVKRRGTPGTRTWRRVRRRLSLSASCVAIVSFTSLGGARAAPAPAHELSLWGSRTSAARHPHPRLQPGLCGWEEEEEGRRVAEALPLLCDPDGLLPAAFGRRQRERALAALAAFEAELGEAHLGPWGATAGVALVRAAAAPAPAFAAEVARAWGLDGPRGLLVLLQVGPRPAAVLAGGLTAAPGFAATAAGALPPLRAGALGEAAEAALAAAGAALSGGWPPERPAEGAGVVRQRLLESWHSEYQKGEIYENACGEARCRELFLEDVRQLSERFERYYHEAMAFPALNALGASGARRVLILGGGDGGIATHALSYDTVEQVVVVDIDERVSSATRAWMPRVASGLADPRCELLHEDAIEWVGSQLGRREFDLVVIDFTDEPVEGSWSLSFFQSVRGLLTGGGVLVQNVGTMTAHEEMTKLFHLHSSVFGTVYPISIHTPDYHSPYLLALSADRLDPLEVDWRFWERQRIDALLYSPEVHEAFFAVPADVLRTLGLGVPGAPARPRPLRAPLPRRPRPPAPEGEEEEEEELVRSRTAHGEVVVLREAACGGAAHRPAGCRSLLLNDRVVLGRHAAYRHEAMALPAMNLLGGRARRVLLLGGGTSSLAPLVLGFPQVERLAVVEIDAAAVDIVRRHFPDTAAAFSDPRTELIIADALQWLHSAQEEFDAVIVNLEFEIWRDPSPTSRIPRTTAFVRGLGTLLAPHGLLVQGIGSIATPRHSMLMLDLHRAVFRSVWPMAFSSLDGFEWPDVLDGRHLRPPELVVLSSPGHVDPLDVDWELWKHAQVETALYHASLHASLFVLPAELQASLEAAPPRATAEAAGAVAAPPAPAALINALAIEAHGCSEAALNDPPAAGAMLLEMAVRAGLTPLGNLSHHFEPAGVTALLLVSESHLSLHTWPEHLFAAVDVVSCKALGPAAARELRAIVQRALRCREVSGQLDVRGIGPFAGAAAAHEGGGPVHGEL